MNNPQPLNEEQPLSRMFVTMSQNEQNQENVQTRSKKFQDLQLPKTLTDEIAQQQFNFICEYRQNNQVQLNSLLRNYVDLEDQQIWSEDFIKEKKMHLKNNSTSFRVVKKGSFYTYLLLHILVIFVILLMAVFRSSLISLGYVIILLPHMNDGASILNQREIFQEQRANQVKNKINQVKQDIEATALAEIRQNFIKKFKIQRKILSDDLKRKAIEYLYADEEHSQELKQKAVVDLKKNMPEFKDLSFEQISILMVEFYQDPKWKGQKDHYEYILHLIVDDYKNENKDYLESQKMKLEENEQTFKALSVIIGRQKAKEFRKSHDKKTGVKFQWEMINTIKFVLLFYSLLDFALTNIYQIPIIQHNKYLDLIGLRKIFVLKESEKQDSQSLNFYISMDIPNFLQQCFNCVILTFILFQTEIFNSSGYEKFITQENGSMNMLVQLAEVKGKSYAYIFNNRKIRQITSVQKQREQLITVVEMVKQKINQWRQAQKQVFAAYLQGGQQVTESKVRVRRSQSDDQLIIGRDGILDKESKKMQSIKQFKKTAKNGIVKKVKFEEQEFNINLQEQEFQEKINELTKQIVSEKLKKQRKCVRFYIWLNRHFAQQLIFEKNREKLLLIQKKLASGQVNIPTYLEEIMHNEVHQILMNFYEKKEKREQLELDVQKMKEREGSTLMEITQMDEKVKLNQMTFTWKFTKFSNMVSTFLETIFLIVFSQSQGCVFVSMLLSMYVNAGLVSLFYPIAAFGYGMLEETRPGKQFWRIVRTYTTILLLIKFICTLKVMKDNVINTEFWKTIQASTLIGILTEEDNISEYLYMFPEIFIIFFIMINEIKLKSIGLYDKVEEEVENILDGTSRVREQGNEEKLKKKLDTQNNRNMQKFMMPLQQQFKKKKDLEKLIKLNIQQDLSEKPKSYLLEHFDTFDMNCCVDQQYQSQQPQVSLKADQEAVFKELSNQVNVTSKKFDLDSRGTYTFLDKMIEKNCIQKVLESDSLTYVEGYGRQNILINWTYLMTQKKKKDNWENLSSVDNQLEYVKSTEKLDQRTLQEKSNFFDNSHYFKKIFPPLQIQKPGEDWYGFTTFILVLMAFYMFFFFEKFTFDPAELPFMKGQNSLFQGESALTFILLIILIILERIANRSNTKKFKTNSFSFDQKDSSDQKFFATQNFFQHQNEQSMRMGTMKILKTNEIDVEDKEVKHFLQIFERGDNNQGQYQNQNVSYQQKIKFFLHWIFLIFGHLYIFWYIPMKSNYQIYNSPRCDRDKEQSYSCANFHDNSYLKILYVMLILYLCLSAKQLAQGYPLKKKASCLYQYYNGYARLGTDIAIAIPFLIEIRCVIDYITSKTSLDFYQFISLFHYHYRFYGSYLGNRGYTTRKLGAVQTRCDKFLCGYFVAILLFFVIIGPLYFFSQFSPFIEPSKVISAEVKFKFHYTNLVTYNYQKNNQTFETEIYSQRNPFIKDYDDLMLNQTDFKNKIETTSFKSNQIQNLTLSKYSDSEWDLSTNNKQYLFDTLEKFQQEAFDGFMNFSLIRESKFYRSDITNEQEAYLSQKRQLNLSNFYDCMTAKELKEIAEKSKKLNCSAQESQSVIFTQAFNNLIALGERKEGHEISTKNAQLESQMNDVRITYYFCDQIWKIEGANLLSDDIQFQEVDDVNTCSLKNNQGSQFYENQRRREESQWTKIMITIFSLLTTSSLLATFNPGTFYTSVTIAISSVLRTLFLTNYWQAKFIETNSTMPLIQLCEACYMFRHEEDLVKEDETYRMLQEIMREDALFKSLTGSCLKGEMDPSLENLTEGQKKKFMHILMLENKGFEVNKLKERYTQECYNL